MVNLLDPSDLLAHMKHCLTALDSLGYSAPAALVSQAISHIEGHPPPAQAHALSSISELDSRVDFAILDDFMDQLHHK